MKRKKYINPQIEILNYDISASILEGSATKGDWGDETDARYRRHTFQEDEEFGWSTSRSQQRSVKKGFGSLW